MIKPLSPIELPIFIRHPDQRDIRIAQLTDRAETAERMVMEQAERLETLSRDLKESQRQIVVLRRRLAQVGYPTTEERNDRHAPVDCDHSAGDRRSILQPAAAVAS